jgi:uncharacterized protein YkwD
MMWRAGFFLGLIFILGVAALVGPQATSQVDQDHITRQELAALEKALLALTNGERQKNGLPPLQLSDTLTILARRHSADMARRDRLAHESSTGQTYEDRLVAGGLYFAGGGENVVRSPTAAAGLIHKSLMISPEHRENILKPEFDLIGVGAAKNAWRGAYFITEDFLKRFEILDAEESSQRAILVIQQIRRAHSLPPIAWEEKANGLAQKLAQARATGRKLPAIPSSFGEVHVFFVVAPEFERLEEHEDQVCRPVYEEGGIGVAFSKSRDNPGGAYIMALVLLPKNQYLSLTDEERKEVVRGTINRYRQERRLPELVWKKHLTDDAVFWAVTYTPTRPQRPTAIIGRQKVLFSFETVDLKQIPPGIENLVLDPKLLGIGVRLVYKRTPEFPRGAFLVTAMVE